MSHEVLKTKIVNQLIEAGLTNGELIVQSAKQVIEYITFEDRVPEQLSSSQSKVSANILAFADPLDIKTILFFQRAQSI
jgi:hypothetical protein